MRYAAIDIGTNSCRLLIAELGEDGLKILHRDMQTTRIGQGTAASKMLSPDAVRRTLDCLRDFKTIIGGYQVDHTDIVATSAVREAGNRDEFVEEAWRECRFNVRVIDGNEEAALSYLGVKKGLSLIASPLVVDLGGGSTEFMLENAGGVFALSLPLGAVRATETRMNSDAIRRALAVLNQHKAEWADNPLVFVGGTAATLAAVKLKLREYRSELVHGQMLSCQDVNEIYNKLNSLTLPERRLIPGLQPERADIIPSGALIIKIIMEELNRDYITVSESDILDGMIWKNQGREQNHYFN